MRKKGNWGRGRSGRENGSKWISQMEEAFLQCSLEKGKKQRGGGGRGREGEGEGEGEGGGERTVGRTAGKCEDRCTLAHRGRAACFCCNPAWSCHEWTHSSAALDPWILTWILGRSSWLKESFLPKLHLTTAPDRSSHTFAIGGIWVTQNASSLPRAWGRDRWVRRSQEDRSLVHS